MARSTTHAVTERVSHYSRLGVHRGSTPQEILAAWKSMSRKMHPDACITTQTPQEQEAQSAEFAALSDAYNVLRNAKTKFTYDVLLDISGSKCTVCNGRGFTTVKVKGSAVAYATVGCPTCASTGRILRFGNLAPETSKAGAR